MDAAIRIQPDLWSRARVTRILTAGVLAAGLCCVAVFRIVNRSARRTNVALAQASDQLVNTICFCIIGVIGFMLLGLSLYDGMRRELKLLALVCLTLLPIYGTSAALTNFQQMQLEIQKRLSHGLMFRTEYDWTRDLTTGNPYTTPQNAHDLAANYGNDPLQYRHRFLIYYLYELPVGRGKHWLPDANGFMQGIAGGWQVSGIVQYHSGDPLTVFLENPGTKVGWLATWMDRVPGNLYAGRQSGHDTVNGVQWFNTAAFAPPQPWTWGNAAPNLIFGPGFGQWDFSVMKQFHLFKGDENRLEFKVDFFNLFNHYNLGDPNTSVADTRDGGAPDPTAGKIYGGAAAYTPRVVQLGLRLFW